MSLFRPTLRIRIYISMLAIILFSLLVIGITTIIYFNSQNEAYHIERLKRKEHSIIASLTYFFKDELTKNELNTVSKEFEEELTKLADINNIQINIYELDGDILMSSNYDFDNPDYYKTSIPEKYLNQLKTTGSRQVEELDDDNISTYSYLISKDSNLPIAIVNLPYNRNQNPDSNLLKPFLTVLIEIYIILLIVASLIAFFLSNYITKTIRTISDKIRSVEINKVNEPIEWPLNDEIGVLVSEYNKMIVQLDQSTKKLAQSEREEAWREMAKQVAHEIKNPLTPMKLSVQHLERSLKSNDTEFDEKMKSFSERMIQQIDTLSSIATEFSNFAKMPKSNIREVDLIKIIEASVYLFNNEKNVEIIFEKNNGNHYLVQGDDEQLTRVFNNLLKNAVQSIPDHKKGVITVSISTKRTVYLISVKDNGIGISDEQHEKIFVPNFTTKSSGSGLGLAMVQQIITAHNGSIYFESKEGEGSTFYVELPLG
jgi:two-component system, NtrC family, nitrogen regulation sensor histidine kinase NtrY